MFSAQTKSNPPSRPELLPRSNGGDPRAIYNPLNRSTPSQTFQGPVDRSSGCRARWTGFRNKRNERPRPRRCTPTKGGRSSSPPTWCTESKTTTATWTPPRPTTITSAISEAATRPPTDAIWPYSPNSGARRTWPPTDNVTWVHYRIENFKRRRERGKFM